jgi:hypothetical protein
MNDYAGLLFASPSFLEGAARTLDIGSTFTQYNTMSSPEQADAAALLSDWQAVGEDLKQTMARFAAQYELQPETAE